VRRKYEFKGTFGNSRHRWKDSVRVELGKTDCPEIKLYVAQDRFYWLELAKEH
jgi:hypothetical protein